MASEHFIDELYEKFSGNGVCRTCWRTSANMKTITDVSIQYLKEICNIKLSQRTVPYKMCMVCYTKLRRAVQFRKDCLETGGAILHWVQKHAQVEEIQMDSKALFDVCSSFRQTDKLFKNETLSIECIENCSNNTDLQYLTIYSHRYRKPCKISSDNNPPSDIKDIEPNHPKLDESDAKCIAVKREIVAIEYHKEECHRQINELKLDIEDCRTFETDVKAASCEAQEQVQVKTEHNDCNDSSNEEVASIAAVTQAEKVGKKAAKKGVSGSLKKEEKDRSLKGESTDAVEEEGSKVKNKKRRTKSDATVKPSRVVYYAFDPTKANIIKLSLEEQRAELEQIRRSDKYLSAAFRCQPCAKYYVTEIGLQQHMDKHKEGGMACTVCGLAYSTARTLRLHMRTHSERYACVRCTSVFSSRPAFVKHSALHDDDTLTFICSFCGKINKSIRSHKMHEKLHANLRPYKCDKCPRDFTHSTGRNRHIMRVHTNVRPFACPVCPSAFVTSTALQAHSLKHSSHQAHYCVECDVRFKSVASLTTHLTTSSRHALPSALRFSCEECDARYATRPRLLEHVQSAHVRSASYVCSTCSKAFHTASALRHHCNSTHKQGERPRCHKCEYCDKAFTTRTILKHHRMIHTGERPYSCPTCAKTFRHTAALWTHNKLVHNRPNKPKETTGNQQPTPPTS